MIIALESIRTNRIRALRALRTLHYVDPKYEEDCQCYNPFKPGLKEAQEMLDSLPLSARILPEDLSKFEEDFYIQVLSNPPSDYDMLGDCVCGPDTSTYGPMPWAAIHFPGGVFAIGGGVRDLADTILRLLEDGHPEDKITIELLGGGPTRWPVPIGQETAMPKHDETLCRICGGPDDSNNGEGPCLECQADQMAFEIDRTMDMVRDDEFPSEIARALMQRKKSAEV
jgi:hypothetical protein